VSWCWASGLASGGFGEGPGKWASKRVRRDLGEEPEC
jgi:hypothetical protein